MVDSQSPRLPPESRRPLRERCRVTLTIVPISYQEWNTVYDTNDELVLVFEDDQEKKGEKDKQKHPPPHRSPSLLEESHLVEVMDGLYIALVDDDANLRALRTFDDEPFTHIVRVSYRTPYRRHPLSVDNWRKKEGSRSAGVQRLDLLCPAISLRLCTDQTALGPNELHAAREFLTLALPYGSTKWWPEELRKFEGDKKGEPEAHYVANEDDNDDDDPDVQVVYLAPDHCELEDLLNGRSDRDEQDNKVNVLIVAPTRRAVDVLSVLFCYLSFLEDTTPDELVETDYFDHVWDNVRLGLWSMSYVELIARCE